MATDRPGSSGRLIVREAMERSPDDLVPTHRRGLGSVNTLVPFVQAPGRSEPAEYRKRFAGRSR